ncbi:helix-turn-helix domain-containing protein [Microbacterium indicum]|uniref:helix-turn-helix domain-containing protein n=1 Tax=Microbacterium indicum TaxID=358100 RepID=UPI0003F78445|nr:helix-turn-helix transcriptional regulator [Microbacterium indicum]
MAQKHSDAGVKVGRLIAHFRGRTGMSARAIAECADMDLTNYQRIERGEGNPTISTLLQIAVALEIEVSDLVEGLQVADLQNGRDPYGYTHRADRRRQRGGEWA